MSTLSYAVADSATMLRRQLRHMLRYASVMVFLVACRSSSCCCSSTSSAARWAPGSAARQAAAPSTWSTSFPESR
jgi:hypothetical protein